MSSPGWDLKYVKIQTSSLYLNGREADRLNYCLTVIFSKYIPYLFKQSYIVLRMTNEKLQQCSDLFVGTVFKMSSHLSEVHI